MILFLCVTHFSCSTDSISEAQKGIYLFIFPITFVAVVETLPRMNSLVVGPGLGRDRAMREYFNSTVRKARERSLPIVFDGVHLASLRLMLW